MHRNRPRRCPRPRKWYRFQRTDLLYRAGGSRFVGWQVYKLAAGGSREEPSVLLLLLALSVKRFWNPR
jgi:hypothetical protein